jgi:predicted nucleic acid-binding protein
MIALQRFDKAATIELGRLYAELSRAGRSMQVPDLQIAPSAH